VQGLVVRAAIVVRIVPMVLLLPQNLVVVLRTHIESNSSNRKQFASSNKKCNRENASAVFNRADGMFVNVRQTRQLASRWALMMGSRIDVLQPPVLQNVSGKGGCWNLTEY
jgi:hypothetical protein